MGDSEEDIINKVRAKYSRMKSMEIDDDDNDEDDAIVEKPGCCEALAASLTLQRYIADTDKPFACQLEALLSHFGRQTRSEETQSLQPWIISHLLNTQNTCFCGAEKCRKNWAIVKPHTL